MQGELVLSVLCKHEFDMRWCFPYSICHDIGTWTFLNYPIFFRPLSILTITHNLIILTLTFTMPFEDSTYLF